MSTVILSSKKEKCRCEGIEFTKKVKPFKKKLEYFYKKLIEIEPAEEEEDQESEDISTEKNDLQLEPSEVSSDSATELATKADTENEKTQTKDDLHLTVYSPRTLEKVKSLTKRLRLQHLKEHPSDSSASKVSIEESESVLGQVPGIYPASYTDKQNSESNLATVDETCLRLTISEPSLQSQEPSLKPSYRQSKFFTLAERLKKLQAKEEMRRKLQAIEEELRNINEDVTGLKEKIHDAEIFSKGKGRFDEDLIQALKAPVLEASPKSKSVEIQVSIDDFNEEKLDTPRQFFVPMSEISQSTDSFFKRVYSARLSSLSQPMIEEQESSLDLSGRRFLQSYFDKYKEQSSVEAEEEYFSFLKPEDEEITPMKQAQDYLKQRRIHQFFKYLGALLISSKPCNPIDFLIDFLEKCCKFRYGLCEPPLLFDLKHIESLYETQDPMHLGEITTSQYTIALLTLGITNIPNPPLNEHLMIPKESFIHDAYRLLVEQLLRMISVPMPKQYRMIHSARIRSG